VIISTAERKIEVARETRRRKAIVVTDVNFAMTALLTTFSIALSLWPGCNERM
jgi:hypothetical protein